MRSNEGSMHITALTIEEFRSIARVELSLGPGLTVFVGENNVGKSAVFAALRTTVANAASSGSLDSGDLRFGSPMRLKCELALDDAEKRALIWEVSSGIIRTKPDRDVFEERLAGSCRSPTLHCFWDGGEFLQLALQLGNIWLHPGNIIGPSDERPLSIDRQVSHFVDEVIHGDLDLRVPLTQAYMSNQILKRAIDATGVPSRLRVFSDFRKRPAIGGRVMLLESFDGNDTVNVLFTLKNHPNSPERDKYQLIKDRFESLFPGLTFETVEPTAGNADIQFHKGNRDYPIRLDKSGAGVAQMLTLLTNLIARERFIFVIEEPETHLHPHAKRQLHKVIVEAARTNQVLVITHDAHFAWADPPPRLVRVFAGGDGATASSLDPGAQPERDRERLMTSLRDLHAREMLFARVVLLVEDETLRVLFLVVASKLGIDLDAHGISVVSVNGHDGFKPFEVVLKALEIQCVRVRDWPWDKATEKPPLFWSWGDLHIEIEDFVERRGLGHLLDEARRAKGNGKPRVMRWVAEKIDRKDLPEEFKQILDAAVTLAQEAAGQ